MSIKDLNVEHRFLAERICEKSLAALCHSVVIGLKEAGFSHEYVQDFLKLAMPDHVYGHAVLSNALAAIGAGEACYASVEALTALGKWAKLPEEERGPCPLAEYMHFMTEDGEIVNAAELSMTEAATHTASKVAQ